MTRTVRPWQRRTAKFSVVGVIGIGVQLVVLAALTRLKVNYLLATCFAVEGAIIHNFFWHQSFTWSDRSCTGTLEAVGRFARFHLSNGLISLIGNLLLMRLLVGRLSLPVIAANLISISLCFVANFVASDRWVFSFAVSADEADKRVETNSCVYARASVPMCARRKEHKAGPRLRPEPTPTRFGVPARTATGPTVHPE